MTAKMDGRRRQWLAVDSQYARSKLAIGLRDRFGALGVLVFDLFLRACKRNHVPGEITYSCEADFLNLIGMPGLALRDERGEPWDLETFFSYLGQQKNTCRTRSGGLTNVRSTRWERWENSRSRVRDVGPMPARNEQDPALDKTGQDTDKESDIDIVDDEVEISQSVWSEYARRKFESQPAGSVHHPLKWMQATERMAREEHWLRAQHLLRHFDITNSMLVSVLLSESSPQWLVGYRREDVS